MSEYGGPDWADHARDPQEQFWDDKAHNYPRGHGPAWNGEDAPSEGGHHGLYVDDDQEPDPDRYLADPGFGEHQVDTHHDPDHGREDHRIGAILRQAEQWPERMGNINDPSTQEAWQAHVMKDKDTGLGYDALVHRNPKGDGWDVVREVHSTG